ncbi:TetR family transcriptional regulator [Rhodobacter sp. NTK016B]|uniref:TetR/AcrR family transcriptional regulator n=1 Tax=Rhodobacter sp. NTK016B TaxID=2759676 RepID=UPI001A8C6474|nr:TetR/AcrR family transcriptional regulator [Rhodobacter sp. NTK016B]MBN8294805.1 TetR family transcriptional regulator [Rhodobacter sp. NTK016B]
MSEETDQKKNKKLRGRAAAVGLTKERIVDFAIAQIDEKGLHAFSMRELARALGVSPNNIYWHVGGTKEDLFGEVAARFTAEVSQSLPRDKPWQDRLRTVFQSYREAVSDHANVAPLLGAQLKSNGVANLALVEAVLTALHDAGYRGPGMRDAFNALIGGLCGFVTMEFAPAPDEKANEWEALFAERVAAIDPDLFPYTHSVLPEVSNRIFVLRWENGKHVSYASGFDFLLDLLIEGLSARAPNQPAKP